MFQHNPRTLPALTAGNNELEYHAAREVRRELPVRLDKIDHFASGVTNATYAERSGQGFIVNEQGSAGEVIFALTDPEGLAVSGFDVGARFLDLRNGLAPDKFTAEVRKVEPWPAPASTPVRASLSWSTKADGPWQTLWTYDDHLKWLDGQAIDRTLRWPEVDRSVRGLPRGTRRVYVRYAIDGMAIDSLRMAVIREVAPSPSVLRVTHVWNDNGQDKEFTQVIPGGSVAQQYVVNLSGDTISNEALIMECPAAARPDR